MDYIRIVNSYITSCSFERPDVYFPSPCLALGTHWRTFSNCEGWGWPASSSVPHIRDTVTPGDMFSAYTVLLHPNTTMFAQPFKDIWKINPSCLALAVLFVYVKQREVVSQAESTFMTITSEKELVIEVKAVFILLNMNTSHLFAWLSMWRLNSY